MVTIIVKDLLCARHLADYLLNNHVNPSRLRLLFLFSVMGKLLKQHVYSHTASKSLFPGPVPQAPGHAPHGPREGVLIASVLNVDGVPRDASGSRVPPHCPPERACALACKLKPAHHLKSAPSAVS